METSVDIGVFAGTWAFAVAAAGSFAAAVAVVAERIVVDGCNSAVHVAATEPDGFAGFAGFAVAVGSRRKVRPWVAAAASGRPRSPSAPARTPHIAHSRPADRPRMEAAYCNLFFFFYTVFAVIVVLYRMYASHSSLTTYHDVGERASRARRVRISHKTWRKPRPKSSKFP